MRLIDADALIDDAMDRYCKDCDKRKGIKSGKWRIVYEIGEAPCRACDIDNMVNDLENAPTISPDMAQVLAYECGKDSVQVVRCKDCKHSDWYESADGQKRCYCMANYSNGLMENDYCSRGERSE